MNNNRPQIDEISSRFSSNFHVSSSVPDDISYKLKGFLCDVHDFHMKYVPHEDNKGPMKFDFPPIVKSSDESVVSGYCSRTNSSASDASSSSTWKNRLQHDHAKEVCQNTEVTEEQLKAINVYFSSLSTSVIVCMTPSRVYELDNVYELSLQETGNNLFGWNQFGEGILFVQFLKSDSLVKTFLCLANPDNCHLYSKIPLTRDSRLHSIRSCLRYLMTSDETGLTKVYGIYFDDELKASEFSEKLYCIFDCLNDNNETYHRRMSSSVKDSQLITWLQSRSVPGRSGRSLTDFFFKHKSKSSELLRPNISDPSEFEQTLHIPLNEYSTK